MTGVQRSIRRHRALRAGAFGGVLGGTFALGLDLAVAPGETFAAPAALAVICALVTAWEWRTVNRLRAQADPAARQAERSKTLPEAVAEAVEAQRQQKWAAIAERAYVAAGGREPRPPATAVKLDPRWEWQLVHRLGVADEWVKVRCLHTEVIPVESLSGDAVAQLCLTCDTPFPPPREP